jgi:hypothetical protein
MKHKALLMLPALIVALLQGQERAPFVDSIHKETVRPEIYFLASDAMQGRLTDTPTNFIAEEYIKSRFEAIGLAPAGSSRTYYQNFNLMVASLGNRNALEVAVPGQATLRLQPGQDYYPHSYSASAQVRGPVVYAGFGITAPDLDYDDFRGADVQGKVALVINDEPGERDPNSPFDGLVRFEGSSPLRKALFAQARGAIGILFTRDLHNHPEPANFEGEARRYWPERPPRIPRYTLATWADKVRIPAAEISSTLAAILVQGTGKSLEEISRSAETRNGITPLPLPGVEVALTTSVERHNVPERNVVGVVEGSDPKVREESIIICGHHDHNGADGDQIFVGADDNITGVVGAIAIAEAYMKAVQAGHRPRRSIIFASWEAEERGLLGSWAYTENPFLPLDKIMAVLNMDMIGRNEEVPESGEARFRGLEPQTAESNRNSVNILGTVRCPECKSEAEKANAGIGLDLRFRYDNNASNLLRRSDHWPFVQYGVPGLWFLTGLHPDYHTMYDRPERINYPKMEKILRLIYQMSWDLAQQDGRLKLLSRVAR